MGNLNLIDVAHLLDLLDEPHHAKVVRRAVKALQEFDRVVQAHFISEDGDDWLRELRELLGRYDPFVRKRTKRRPRHLA